ncbi:sigma-70 family RNA polymerase sigma factor [Paenibacillus glycanilyticus]|uniref:DNA-directed RNA polymerase sigma-70 factor n=1 Tax=Paenibacillus glycanilyticus TaxID=126569 RepID=A0ABQ6G8R5_9BACL|nr:sigma-70 family RNA polymerase sigma factor [Paenibacillus glycanilyticus]GLX67336.1 DNA-directed RNA polymerase sigma-70 factor [Paenibacillus glycanilyticus]
MGNESLVAAAKRGDDAAFYNLISQHKEKMYRIAYSYLKNETDALEAVQEATCRAYMKIHKLKEPDYFGSWLIRILMNYCADEVKKKARRKGGQEAAAAALESHAADGEAALIERVMLESAVEQLDENARTVIQLKYYHDLTITEIARTLEKPEGTIKTWLHKALGGLRQRLAKEGEPHE